MSRPVRSLRQIFTSAVAVTLCWFLGVFLTVSAGGFVLARLQWQRDAGDQIRTVLGTRLDSLIASGTLQGEVVSRQVGNLLGPSVYLLVFGPEGDLVYWSWKGRSWYREDDPEESRRSLDAEIALLSSLPPEDHPVFQEGLFERLRNRGELTDLWSRGTKVGSYAAGRHLFELSEDNRQLLANLSLALLVGLGAATAAGWWTAWRRLRPSLAQASEVAAGLRALTNGDREVRFTAGVASEWQTVASSALRLQESLVREQELRRQWAQDIAHDLKTPLAGLRIQLEGLAEGVLPASPERFSRLLADLRQLDGLTSGLLELGRLESPEMVLAPRPVRVRDLFSELRESLEPLRLRSGRPIEWSETPGIVLADPELLRRALDNLLSNALLHSRGEGAIRVRCGLEASWFRVEVVNPGTLPSAGLLPISRLFRGDPARTSGGHGLGLSIARRIAELHGGTLEVESQPGNLVVSRLAVPAGS